VDDTAKIERVERKLDNIKVTCNRHVDCDAAEAEVLKKYPTLYLTRNDIGLNFHCHDEECEDCFGDK
jgi:hypothetical protein